MPIIVNKIGEYRNQGAVENLIEYMSGSPFARSLGGRGITSSVPRQAAEDFAFVKNMYDKNNRKQISHIIIGTQEKENIIELELFGIALSAAEYLYQKGFQSYFVIHCGSYENPDYLHLHLAVNTINYINGTRYYETFSNSSELKNALEGIYKQYRWFLINDTSLSWEE